MTILCYRHGLCASWVWIFFGTDVIIQLQEDVACQPQATVGFNSNNWRAESPPVSLLTDSTVSDIAG